MLIDFSLSRISLKNTSNLKTYQVLQLKSWGFISSKEGLELDGDGKILEKVINYLDEEEIQHDVTENAKKLISNSRKLYSKLEFTRLVGQKIKLGDNVRGSFHQFVTKIKKDLPRKLMEHQLKAAYHLYKVGNGANFSVPGSGKTAVVLSVYNKLRLEGKVNTLLVVGPTSCFAPWQKEYRATLGKEPIVRILAGGKPTLRRMEYYPSSPEGTADLYLISFQSLLNDVNDLKSLLNEGWIKAFFVVDEAHYIKQIEGNWAEAVLNLAKLATFRCVLTGTPMPKGFSDIYNLFDFLWPEAGVLSSTDKHQVLNWEKMGDDMSAKSILRNKIGPLFYRVSKRHLRLTEPIFHKPFIIKMNKYEGQVYESLVKKIRNFSRADYLKEYSVIEKLIKGRMTRLRQATSYTKLLSSAIDGYDERFIDKDSRLIRILKDYDKLELPAKVESLKNFIPNLIGKSGKVIIWSNFVNTIKLITAELNGIGIKAKYIYGETPVAQTALSEEETREKIIDEFLNPESGLNVIVANPAACAESISLHKTCHNAIYYDLSYNCAQYLQSLDRIHRVGGSENKYSNYYYFMYEGSLEKDILNNLRRKAKRMFDLMEDDYSVVPSDINEENLEANAYKRLFK